VTENCLVISGTVINKPKLSSSPAGIYHCQFFIEHRSLQNEDGLNRQAYVRIQIAASGQWSKKLTRDLTAGSNIKVTGFLNRHESPDGLAKLVLHAQQIEMIN
jgi:primosomal replication protein N